MILNGPVRVSSFADPALIEKNPLAKVEAKVLANARGAFPPFLEASRAQAISVRGNRAPADIDIHELRRQQLQRGVYLRNPDGSRATEDHLVPAA